MNENARVLSDTGVPFYFTTTFSAPNVSRASCRGHREARMGAVDLAGVRHHHLHGGVAGNIWNTSFMWRTLGWSRLGNFRYST